MHPVSYIASFENLLKRAAHSHSRLCNILLHILNLLLLHTIIIIYIIYTICHYYIFCADNFNMVCAKLFMCVQEDKTE